MWKFTAIQLVRICETLYEDDEQKLFIAYVRQTHTM